MNINFKSKRQINPTLEVNDLKATLKELIQFKRIKSSVSTRNFYYNYSFSSGFDLIYYDEVVIFKMKVNEIQNGKCNHGDYNCQKNGKIEFISITPSSNIDLNE